MGPDISGPLPFRALQWWDDPPWRHHQDRQPRSQAKCHRSGVELPVSGTYRERERGDPCPIAQGHPRHRVEGTDQTLYALSLHGRAEQEANRRRCDRERTGWLHLGIGQEMKLSTV
jgi:hypothetical protein